MATHVAAQALQPTFGFQFSQHDLQSGHQLHICHGSRYSVDIHAPPKKVGESGHLNGKWCLMLKWWWIRPSCLFALFLCELRVIPERQHTVSYQASRPHPHPHPHPDSRQRWQNERTWQLRNLHLLCKVLTWQLDNENLNQYRHRWLYNLMVSSIQHCLTQGACGE